MKAYLVFAGSQYYPDGGMADCVGRFDDFEAAQQRAKNKMYEWWQIVDTSTLIIIEAGRND